MAKKIPTYNSLNDMKAQTRQSYKNKIPLSNHSLSEARNSLAPHNKITIGPKKDPYFQAKERHRINLQGVAKNKEGKYPHHLQNSGTPAAEKYVAKMSKDSVTQAAYGAHLNHYGRLVHEAAVRRHDKMMRGTFLSLSPADQLKHSAKLKGEPGAAQGGSGQHGGNPCHDNEGKFC